MDKYPNPVTVIYCKYCAWYDETGYEPDLSGEEYLNNGYCTRHRHDTQRCNFCSSGMLMRNSMD